MFVEKDIFLAVDDQEKEILDRGKALKEEMIVQ